MTDCIERHKGYVSKFMGTGLLVIFGAPSSYFNNASNAIYCAFEMFSLLNKYNELYKAKYGHEVELGIGINTGEAISGHVGSPKHIEYMILGKTVDTVMRLQELSHNMTKGVLMTQSTYDEVKDHFESEALETKARRAREEQINIYRVIKPVTPK
jgi:adenylate cyclase